MATSAGQGSISIGHKQRAIPAPGPPFALNSADNGLSVDPITGRIVLGGDAGTPAPLLNDREIDLDGFFISFLDQGSAVLGLDPINQLYVLGDSGGAVNSTYFRANVGQPSLEGFVNAIGRFNFDTTQSSIGDLSAGLDGLVFTLDHVFTAGVIQSLSGRVFSFDAGFNVEFGDLDNMTTGTVAAILPSSDSFNVANTAGSAVYSINGNPGVNGTFTPPASITVEGGIITAAS